MDVYLHTYYFKNIDFVKYRIEIDILISSHHYVNNLPLPDSRLTSSCIYLLITIWWVWFVSR